MQGTPVAGGGWVECDVSPDDARVLLKNTVQLCTALIEHLKPLRDVHETSTTEFKKVNSTILTLSYIVEQLRDETSLNAKTAKTQGSYIAVIRDIITSSVKAYESRAKEMKIDHIPIADAHDQHAKVMHYGIAIARQQVVALMQNRKKDTKDIAEADELMEVIGLVCEWDEEFLEWFVNYARWFDALVAKISVRKR